MPCYTIRKTSVNVSNMNLDVLEAGLKAAGFDVTRQGESLIFARSGSYLYHSYEGKRLTISGNDVEAITAEVKQAYSVGAVKRAANQFGWKLSTKDNQQFIAQKRR